MESREGVAFISGAYDESENALHIEFIPTVRISGKEVDLRDVADRLWRSADELKRQSGVRIHVARRPVNGNLIKIGMPLGARMKQLKSSGTRS